MAEEITVQILQLQNEVLQKQLEEARNIIQEKTLTFAEQKVAEKSLLDSNRRLNTLINNLNGVVYRCKNDQDWTMEYISQGITDLTGYPASDFIDNKVRSFNSIIAPQDREGVWLSWQASLDKKQYFADEYRLITSSGEERWVWERGCGIFENDQLVALEGFITDITERKKAQKELLESEEKFRNYIENAPVGIFIINKEGYHIDVNAEGCLLLGYSKEELLNMHASEVIVSGGFGQGPGSFSAIKLNDQFNFEYQIRRKDGSIFNGLLSAVKISENQFLGFLKNIDDIVNVQKELIIAKEKAEESDKLKTAFLQNMSHEIRTPMNAIMGFSEILPAVFDDKPKLEYYTSIIGQRCSDLLSIIDEILDIAKIESGHLVMHYEKCNLFNWLSELDLFFTEYQKGIRKEHLDLRIINKLPENDVVVIDQGKIKQILINLVNNSLKFTEKGKIEVGCKMEEGQQLGFYVSDTGIGILKEKQSFVFDRFAQAVQINSRLYGGTGLGLAIVKGLLDALGGSIWLESESGKGTTFYFTVPYQLFLSDDKDIFVHDRAPVIPNSRTKKILIVEDDHFNLVYLKELFSGTQYVILHAETGKIAIDMALKEEIDLILMDIRLPDMEGYEATKIIKKQKPEIPIIAQTAYASETDKQNALAAGCDDYISKPIRKDLFIRKVNAFLYTQSK